MSDFDDTEQGREEAGGEEETTGRRKPVLLKGSRRFMRRKFQGKTFLIPSFITLVGIFCGFLATVSAFKGNYVYACKCIGLAILLDGLDGRVARSLNATSAFGREFDSLSDLVAFGVAPAILVYSWAFNRLADEFGLLVSFVFLVCGATRLARFNITSTGEVVPLKSTGSGFQGLPIPGAAAALAALVFYFPEPIENPYIASLIMAYTVFIAILMVSTLEFFSIKHVKLSGGHIRIKIVLLAALVALAWKYSSAMILLGSTAYALSGVIGMLWGRFFPSSWRNHDTFLGMSAK